jgi:hypothetical protein
MIGEPMNRHRKPNRTGGPTSSRMEQKWRKRVLLAHSCRTVRGHCFPGNLRTQRRRRILKAEPAGSELPVRGLSSEVLARLPKRWCALGSGLRREPARRRVYYRRRMLRALAGRAARSESAPASLQPTNVRDIIRSLYFSGDELDFLSVREFSPPSRKSVRLGFASVLL